MSTASASTASRKYDVIVLDIEGTTTPISFVHDVLFPYARDELDAYVAARYAESLDTNAQFRDDVRELIKLAQQDAQSGLVNIVAIPESPVFLDASRDVAPDSAEFAATVDAQKTALIANVRAQIAQDRKSTALKQLQGHMWHVGFTNGVLKGVMFDDTYTALRKWTTQPQPGIRVYIYSSGSVEAQKLIFGYTTRGSLLEHLSGHFDTKIGMKQETASYQRILHETGLTATPERLLFCTDILGEARACLQAGANAVLMLRDGNAPLPEGHGIPTARSFEEIDVGASSA